MPAQLTPSVFLSHSSKDNDFVSRLENELKKNDIEVWVDYDRLEVGNSLYGEIAPAIETVDHFALLWSANSSNSRWVKRELNAALAREDEEGVELILPVLLDNTPLPAFLKHQVYADFTSEENFEQAFKKLLRALKKTSTATQRTKEEGNLAEKLYPDFFLPEFKYFVGRAELLDQIKAALKTDHRASIHDFSGIGKTFTSYKFAHDNHGDYEKIFLIRATREEMLEGLAKCGEMVDPRLASITEQQPRALGFKQWLEENNNWLVIYDNVDEPAKLAPFVPINKGGDCLFTSNFPGVAHLGTQVIIEKLDKDAAEMLLYSRANREPLSKPKLTGEERTAFDALIAEIDGLPLTLNSTGAFICQNDLTFAEFRKIYEEAVWDTEDDFGIYENRQQRSAGKVFSLVYDELCKSEDTGEAVKLLLDSISFISPDEIPAELLIEILKRQHESFEKIENPDSFWSQVRKSLTAYDLLKYEKYKQTFATHRAIQRVIQSRIEKEAENICNKLSETLINFFPEYNYSNRPVCEKYYQHVLALTENAGNLNQETENINVLYSRLGRYQELLGNFVMGETFYHRASKISAVVPGVESVRHTADLNNLANVYASQGRYDEAIEKLEKALQIDKKTIGKEHPDYATDLNNLANVYKSQGRYDEAIEKFEEALRIGENTIGREHPKYAIRLNNLAVVFQSQGRYDEAIEKYEEALRIAEKTIGKEHPSYATRLNNLANVYRSQGRYDEAIEKYQEALRIDEKVIGKEHPDYATDLNNLASVYETQGKFDEALKLYLEALSIDEKTLPANHSYIAQNKANIERCREKLKSS